MIRLLVDFALNNRLLVLAVALLLFIWGIISFHNLPVEAYPDVANNYVQVITQWPGISAEQVEQQVTIPLEIAMNGIPHLEHLRSVSLFGLSSLMLIFDDESENDWNREKVLERLSQVTLPPGVQPQMGTDFSPVGQIYFFTLRSTNPQYDVMDLKSLEDWVIEKQFKSVPNVVDVASFGGPTREYQVRVDPEQADRLWAQPRPSGTAAYQQQHEWRREFHRGRSAADQRARSRPGENRSRHRENRDHDQERHRACESRTSRWWRKVRKSGWANLAGPFTAPTARSSITTMWSRESCS